LSLLAEGARGTLCSVANLLGQSAEASLTVQASDTARALSISPEDVFPEVLATSRMVALMELAAARLMRPLLQDGQLSVGVAMNVTHTAATPVGCLVRAVATYQGLDGKLHRFRVEAFDEAGPIGAGDHSRAIVSTERLLAGAAQRRGPAPAR
jgi:fluoroacetyl-CoA thioesterase